MQGMPVDCGQPEGQAITGQRRGRIGASCTAMRSSSYLSQRPQCAPAFGHARLCAHRSARVISFRPDVKYDNLTLLRGPHSVPASGATAGAATCAVLESL
jgi:hypothetical protein